ncbi:E3 ubiquitin-protein ligase HUWE1 isoform X2 [Drosophila guanche]|uniref:HECT-type E3 ubiquitin transferase n=1 Tax=Drosophila guanche TaxID=7266 RepID=A0A3B0J9H7_DROGU|nr:E3 ubiquitin-protein ligase HUWE1 isoform X2 [Drosophila guanche]SPP78575.1 blast:E3 ubiquitin-protein ligase HUWE1 [Drosophila guanche]
MKVDTVKLKKGSSELTSECRELIDELTKRRTRSELLEFLDKIHVWIYGKCELYHWIEILDRFDKILDEAARHVNSNEFVLQCDTQFHSTVGPTDVTLLLHVLNFTTLLIEHSFSRHLYNSIEHLTQLLSSQNMDIVLAVLNLLYMFSKRSNFIPRLPFEKKELLIVKLFNIAERWGDPNYGLSLKDCCIGEPKLEFLYQLCIDYVDEHGHAAQLEIPDMMDLCHTASAPDVIKTIAGQISKPSEAIKMRIAHRVRLISGFNNYKLRLQFVQARLQAVSILIYSNALQDNTDKVLYPGFGEELCELIDKEDVILVEIRAAVLRTLTSMLHFDRNPNVPRAGSRLMKIVHYTGAERQGGTLPLLVRDCINNLTTHGLTERYPLILATSLFSLLYHLASYELGGSALVKSGMMQSLLCVISWPGVDLEHITFVTRAVRVIDLITNIDIARFHQNNGLNVFIDRLEKEIKSCCKALADIGITLKESTLRDESKLDMSLDLVDIEDGSGSSPHRDTSDDQLGGIHLDDEDEEPPAGSFSSDPGDQGRSVIAMYPLNSYYARPLAERKAELSQAQLPPSSVQPKKPSCVTQRAALLKSMLNFLKKSIQDHAHFSNMRNIMETSLTQSLRHIIANAEYYGPSLFLLATDVVTVYVFNEPSLLSSLQDLGITSVMLKALLQKDVPATREVLGSLPNVFSALCLNERGLFEFLSYDPFDKVLKVLLSPDYLVAMRRRRSSDPLGDTATNLGNAMDDLIKHHPYLRADATEAIVRLLRELVRLGSDPSFICWRANKESSGSGSGSHGSGSHGVLPSVTASPMVMVAGAGGTASVLQSAANDNNDSSGDDDDDDDEMSSASQQQQQPPPGTVGGGGVVVVASTSRGAASLAAGTAGAGIPGGCLTVATTSSSSSSSSSSALARASVSPPEREAIPLIDYILNVMKFIEAIFSNSDHCREFVLQGGLRPILQLLSLPNLPVDSPVSTTSQAVANVCKAILSQAQETKVLDVALKQLADIVGKLKPLIKHFTFPGGSVLLAELVCCQRLEDGFANAEYTPILHNMSFVHGYVVMLVHLCRNASTDMRAILLKRWGVNRETGVKLLQQLVQLYISLVWESTILLNLCSDEPTQHPDLIWDEIAAQMSAAAGTADPMTEADLSRKLERAAEFRTKYTPEEQFRYIKSLLAASSRLGRALAELLGTLVKLSVGSPQTRQRRINDLISNINKVPTPEAREIARILSSILVNGFSHESILPKPVPKLKLTFLICSVGFTGPMLFDDKRSAFHLMISQFCAENGLKAFFEMFYWALSLDAESKKFEFKQWASMEDLMQSHEDDKRDCPEGTGEFLDAWLQLLEKMVNPRAMLDSPYTMSPRLNYMPDTVPFEPVFYLIHIHQLAMQALRRIWARRPIANYGASMFETMILIVKHLVKSHATLLERYHTRLKEIKFENLYIRSTDDGLNVEHIKRLTDMGFTHYHVVDALRNNGTLEEATDYLLNNPEASAHSSHAATTSAGASGAATAPTPPPTAMEIGLDGTGMEGGESSGGGSGSTISLGPTPTPTFSQYKSGGNPSSYDYKHLKLMPPMIFDRFCDEAIGRAFEFMEAIPDVVNSASDLIAVLYRRHNHLNKQVFVTNFVRNVIQWVDFTLQLFENPRQPGATCRGTRLEECLTGMTATRLFVRLKTSTLLLDENFSDMHRPLVEAINAQDAMVSLVKLLDNMAQWMMEQSEKPQAERITVPRWVQNLVDLIDAIDSISHILQRKSNMRAVCSDVWRWYDASTGKWNAYSEANNELIRNAYNSGERWLHINIGRQRCTVSFNCMTQVSEASGSHRPVFPALKLSEAISNLNNPVAVTKVEHLLNRVIRTAPDGQGTTHTDELISLRHLMTFGDGQQTPTMVQPPAAATAAAAAAATTGTSDETSNESTSGGARARARSPPAPMTTRSKSRQRNAAAAAAAKAKTSKTAAATAAAAAAPAAAATPTIPKRTQRILLSEENVGLSKFDCARIIGSIVSLLQPPILLQHETKLSLLRLCARLTRNYENAQTFIRRGGVKMLLQLQQSCSFMGFPTYAIIILRHVLEAPPVLQEAMERVLGMRAAGIVPVGQRDLIFVLTQVSTAVSRNPQIFVAAAKEMLRGEYLMNSNSSSGNALADDARVMVKSKFGQQPTAAAGGPNPQTPPPAPVKEEMWEDPMVQSAVAVLKELLLALVQPCCHYSIAVPTNDHPKAAAELPQTEHPGSTQFGAMEEDEPTQQPQAAANQPQAATSSNTKKGGAAAATAAGTAGPTGDGKYEPCCCTWHVPTAVHTHSKPTLSRATLLKLLADATRAYQSLLPRVLLGHVYTPADSPLIQEPQMTFMAVLLDRFLPITKRHHVPEVSTMARVLISSLSDCYQMPGVQVQVAEELHAAVARALAQPDSSEKHTRLQVLMSLFPNLIESPMLFDKVHMHRNSMYRVLLRQGVMTYLTKIAQYKDLSNHNTLCTLASILRPMEILLRFSVSTTTLNSKRILFGDASAGGAGGTGAGGTGAGNNASGTGIGSFSMSSLGGGGGGGGNSVNNTYGAIINRRLYPRLAARTAAGAAVERSNGMGGEHVLRDIIRNVLSDRRHAFEFIFNSDEMAVDPEDAPPPAGGGVGSGAAGSGAGPGAGLGLGLGLGLGSSSSSTSAAAASVIDVVGERNSSSSGGGGGIGIGGEANDGPSGSAGAAGGSSSGGPVRPVLNFDQLWDDFLQSEGLRLASRAGGTGGGSSGSGGSSSQQHAQNGGTSSATSGTGAGSGSGSSLNVDPRLRNSQPDGHLAQDGPNASSSGGGSGSGSGGNDNGLGGGNSDGASTSSDTGARENRREMNASMVGDASSSDSDSDGSSENDERNDDEDDDEDDAPDEDADEHSETDVDEERPRQFIEVFDHIYEPESSETASNDADVDADDDDDDDDEDVDDDDADDDDDDEDRAAGIDDPELENQIVDIALALRNSNNRPRRSAAITASGEPVPDDTLPDDDDDDEDVDDDDDDSAVNEAASRAEAFLFERLVVDNPLLMPQPPTSFRVRMNSSIAQPLDIDVNGGDGGGGNVSGGASGSSGAAGGPAAGSSSARGGSNVSAAGGSSSGGERPVASALRPSSRSWIAPDFSFISASGGVPQGASGSNAPANGNEGAVNGAGGGGFHTPSGGGGAPTAATASNNQNQNMSNLLDEQVSGGGTGGNGGATAASGGHQSGSGGGGSGSSTLCNNGVRRRLMYLDQQYCVCMPTHQNPTEETQIEIFTQDALHWWLEEAKALDMESQTDACLYAAHFLLPYLIRELKAAHHQRKQEEAARQAALAAAAAATTATTIATPTATTPTATPIPIPTPTFTSATATVTSAAAAATGAASAVSNNRRSSIPVLIPMLIPSSLAPAMAARGANPDGTSATSSSSSTTTTATTAAVTVAPTAAIAAAPTVATSVNPAEGEPFTTTARSRPLRAPTRTAAQRRQEQRSMNFNIYAEIDLTNEPDIDDDDNDTMTAGTNALATALAQNLQNVAPEPPTELFEPEEVQVQEQVQEQAQPQLHEQAEPLAPPRHPPVPHLPASGSGRPRRVHMRVQNINIFNEFGQSAPRVLNGRTHRLMYGQQRLHHAGRGPAPPPPPPPPLAPAPASVLDFYPAAGAAAADQSINVELDLEPSPLVPTDQDLGLEADEVNLLWSGAFDGQEAAQPQQQGEEQQQHQQEEEDENEAEESVQSISNRPGPPPPPPTQPNDSTIQPPIQVAITDEPLWGAATLSRPPRPTTAHPQHQQRTSATSGGRSGNSYLGSSPTNAGAGVGVAASLTASAGGAPTTAETTAAASTEDGAAAAASGSGTATRTVTDMSPEVRAALGDLEVPEGVDPSFLAALPSEMREEVIQEHLRMQRIRQRAQQNAIQIAHDSLVEVNPEFLAALPLSIQSEVLMQQRIEQQRQAAQTANPEDPVDTAAFFQNLPENLRQVILSDMEESQIASLPPELAAEAQFLRRDWETRNGPRLGDVHPPSNALSRFQNTLQSLEEARWHSSIWYDASGNAQPQHHQHTTIVHHHHHSPNVCKPLALLMMEDENILLDPDSLATLLLFLFVEDQKVNSMRLHRVIRNLCHHEPTRDWIINALINIVQKTNEESANFGAGQGQGQGSKPDWLKLRVDAAFGYKSNIFLINRLNDDGSGSSAKSISINPQAAQMIVRNCLDLLFVLAKHYPSSFVPYHRETKTRRMLSAVFGMPPPVPGARAEEQQQQQPPPAGGTLDFRSRFYRYQVANRMRAMLEDHPRMLAPPTPPPPVQAAVTATPLDETPSTSKAAAAKAAKAATTTDSNSYQTNSYNFWDVVLNIDRQTEERMKHVSKFPIVSQPSWEWVAKTGDFLAFSDSPFGQLLAMLPYKVICRSPHLTDMLVKLLASLSTELPKEEELGPVIEPQMPTLIPMNQAVLNQQAQQNQEMSQAAAALTGETHTTRPLPELKKMPPPPPLTLQLPIKPKRKIYAKNFSQLQLVIEVLTHQCGTTEGLDNVAKLIVNLTQCSQASNAIFIQYLTAAILGLAEEVRQAIQTLLQEIRAYNSNAGLPSTSQQAAAAAAAASAAAAAAAAVAAASGPSTSAGLLPNLAVHEGIMQDRFTAEHVIISAPKNAKPTCELQLPSMKKLMSNSSSQPFFLRTLKIFMQVRDMYENQTVASDDEEDFIDILGDGGATSGSSSDASRFRARMETYQPTDGTLDGDADGDGDGDGDGDDEDDEEAMPMGGSSGSSIGGVACASGKDSSKPGKPTLSQILCLDVLWNTLSECLVALEESKDEFAVLVLQPTVEAFFLIHASHRIPKKGTRGRAASSRASAANTSASSVQDISPLMDEGSGSGSTAFSSDDAQDASNTSIGNGNGNSNAGAATAIGSGLSAHEAQLKQDRHKFLQFAEKHRTVLNQILRQSPTHLSDGPFAVLVDHTRILDFDVKRKYFQTELERLDEGIRREEHTVSVRRVTVFEDSFRVLYRLGPEEWKNRFYIVFEDEEGQDAGGLLREWYVIISREIFNPMYALFCVSPGDRVTYMINPSSHANPNHLSYFKFVGRVIAKAVHDNKLLECYFTRSFYKHILGKQVKHTDMESQDYEFYKGLDYLMKNDISNLGYELTFSTEVQEFGVTQIRDLKPNGRDTPVTEENKFEYVQLVCQLKMSGSIRQQLDAFLEGFYDIIPKHLISIFNEQELELLISGLPDIDIEDLKANTEYHKYTSKSAQIQWFWRALRSFDQADRAKFLQFVTGTSKVPLQGFGSLEGMNGIQKFQIHRDDRSTDRLPCAHTCFNQLDLPMYKSYDKLRSCLLKAIHECSEGFGFA